MTVLALNIGSSSVKYALFEGEEELERGSTTEDPTALLKLKPEAVGHRLVHGGERYIQPTLLTPRVIEELQTLIPFAPLHLPRELGLVKAIQGVPQVGCFDTAFHANMPEEARHYPLPKTLWERGVKRYGFHGLSYTYIAGQLGPSIPDRTVVAHLGNGSSLAALYKGQCVDTTMGFTPTGGVVMGTRSGDLDPGILLYCLRELGMDEPALADMVDHKSGLLGIAGTSDMRELLERRRAQPDAALAVHLFVNSVAKGVATLTTALGGLDLLVFTGGIGEHSEVIRNQIVDRLPFLHFTTEVIPTDEERVIARSTYQVLHGTRSLT
ncbi:MAG: acetate/propionate family kinase [Parachlamydiales bacterium]